VTTRGVAALTARYERLYEAYARLSRRHVAALRELATLRDDATLERLGCAVERPAQDGDCEMNLSPADKASLKRTAERLSALSIRLILDLSTRHLTEELGEGKLARLRPEVVAYETEYGFLMWVPDDPEESAEWSEDVRVPDEVLRIQLYARERGCDYVLFDREGPTVADLPRFNW
jgi:hypothetical protein